MISRKLTNGGESFHFYLEEYLHEKNLSKEHAVQYAPPIKLMPHDFIVYELSDNGVVVGYKSDPFRTICSAANASNRVRHDTAPDVAFHEQEAVFCSCCGGKFAIDAKLKKARSLLFSTPKQLTALDFQSNPFIFEGIKDWNSRLEEQLWELNFSEIERKIDSLTENIKLSIMTKFKRLGDITENGEILFKHLKEFGMCAIQEKWNPLSISLGTWKCKNARSDFRRSIAYNFPALITSLTSNKELILHPSECYVKILVPSLLLADANSLVRRGVYNCRDSSPLIISYREGATKAVKHALRQWLQSAYKPFYVQAKNGKLLLELRGNSSVYTYYGECGKNSSRTNHLIKSNCLENSSYSNINSCLTINSMSAGKHQIVSEQEESRKETSLEVFIDDCSCFNNSQIYTQFCLTKYNAEHFTVVKSLQKTLRCRNADISYCGIKDKLAVTTQYIRIRGYKARQKLYELNRSEHFNSCESWYHISDVGYFPSPLYPGKLRGNRFRITVRNWFESYNECNINIAATKLVRDGFLNYFGTQRFGDEEDWYPVAAHLLKKDYCRAYSLLKCSPAFQLYRRTNLKRQRSPTSETEALNFLKHIPYRELLLHYHAFQSLAWNFVLTKHVQTLRIQFSASSLALEQILKQYLPETIPLLSKSIVSLVETDSRTVQYYNDFLSLYKLSWEDLSFNPTIGIRIQSPSRPTIQRLNHLFFYIERIPTLLIDRTILTHINGDQGLLKEKFDSAIQPNPLPENNSQTYDTQAVLTLQFELSSSTYATVALREFFLLCSLAPWADRKVSQTLAA